MSTTTTPAATVTVLKQAEAAIVHTLHSTADVLDTVGVGPVERAIDRVRQSATDAQQRLAASMTDLRTILGDLADTMSVVCGALEGDIEASARIDLEDGVLTPLSGPAPTVPLAIEARMAPPLPSGSGCETNGHAAVTPNDDVEITIVRDEAAEPTFEEVERVEQAAPQPTCPHCGSHATPTSCVRCMRTLCADCIHLSEAGPICGGCLEEGKTQSPTERTVLTSPTPTKPKRATSRRKKS